jgi:cytosine/uracil/thiamine/allantoin permease
MSLEQLNHIFESDLAFVLSDVGSVVTYGSYQTHGVLINEPKDILQMSSKQYAVFDVETTLTIQTGSIGTITSNTNITVDDVVYLIHRPLLISDGLETKLFLSLAVV